MKYIFLTLLFLFISLSVRSQVDSLYIRPFPEEFTIRPYFYKKFTSLSTQIKNQESITYHPNTPVGIGIGFTYRDYALNIAYSPSLFRDKTKGKTTYIDLQYHYYSRKYLFDLFFQDYKGFYQLYDTKKDLAHLYPDIHINQYGATGQYLFNHRKFSYKAAIYANEKQLRSAGSFQLGGGIYYNKLATDTTQILEGRDRFQNYQISITGGYVHSWIIKRDFFITVGLSTGINLGIENTKKADSKLQITPNIFPRTVIGYNGDNWALLINVLVNHMVVTRSGDMDVSFDTGRMNVCYVHRFGKSPALLKKIKLLNR